MRILAVVTLVSPHGEYGGPLRVAVNQLSALAKRGHSVVLAGAHRGFAGVVPETIDGVSARLYPARIAVPGIGFAGITSPGLLRSLRKHITEFDVVHVHAARDLVTLPAALLAQRLGVRTVLQTHGMIDESTNPLAGPLDALLTRRALGRAAAVTYLTERERASLEVVGRGAAHTVELANGVPEAALRADGSTSEPEVLYLARLAPRKRADLFVEAAISALRDHPTAHFALVGPDEGAGPDVARLIDGSGLADRIRWEGPIAPEDSLERMARAFCYVLPSVDEPYPMSVLEAMSVGLPVVVTDSCGLAPFVREHHAGLVIEPSVGSLRSALDELLGDPAAAAGMGARGRDAVREYRSMDAVARRLEEVYADPSADTMSESSAMV